MFTTLLRLHRNESSHLDGLLCPLKPRFIIKPQIPQHKLFDRAFSLTSLRPSPLQSSYHPPPKHKFNRNLAWPTRNQRK